MMHNFLHFALHIEVENAEQTSAERRVLRHFLRHTCIFSAKPRRKGLLRSLIN